MKIVYSKIIPFPGYKCINLFGILFVHKGATMSEVDINHEMIHTAQIKELWWIFFYILYLIEWMRVGFNYDKICYEKEAYANEKNLTYLKTRAKFAFKNYK